MASILRPLRDTALLRQIGRLAWPTVTEMALQTLVQYVDTAQVGRIGVAASAAVGLTSTTTWLVNAPIGAMAMGVLACISQALGARDEERARRTADQSLFIVLVLGLGMTAVTLAAAPFLPGWLGAEADIRRDASLYFAIICAPMLFRTASYLFASVLRATGNSQTPMQINLLMNAINVTLNFLLINPSQVWDLGPVSLPMWGAGWGVVGAAVATAVSYLVGGTMMFLAVRACPLLRPRGPRPIPHWDTLRRCLRISLPIAADRVTVMLGQVVFTALVARLGTAAVSAHTIALTAEQAFYVPGYGMQAAAATLAGYAVGGRDEERLRESSSAIIAVAVLLMSVLSLFLFLFPAFFMGIFIDTPEVVQLGAKVLRLISLSEPFFAVVIILEGVFNGAGDTRTPFLISLFCMWGVRILATWICVSWLGLGLTAVWLCMIADNMARFFLVLTRYHGHKWLSKLL